MELYNFSWVIPNLLSGCGLPGGYNHENSDCVLADLHFLHKVGVKHLVSLVEMEPGFNDLCEASGLTWLEYPIEDFAIPQDPITFDVLVRILLEKLKKNIPVCIHCKAGIGRTGMLLSCLMGKHLNLSPKDAIIAVRSTRMALDTPLQEIFVHEFLKRGRVVVSLF